MIRSLRNIGIVLLLLLLTVGGLLFLTAKSFRVQTYLARHFAQRMSEDLGAKVSLERLEFSPFTNVALHGILICDRGGDTLIAAERISLGIRRLNLKENRFRFSELEFYRADFRLRQIDSAGTDNLTFLTDYFSQGGTPSEPEPFFLSVSDVVLHGCAFSYRNPFAPPPASETAVNLDDIEVTAIHGRFSDLSTSGDTTRLRSEAFSFREKSGFAMEHLGSAIEIHPGGIALSEMNLVTEHSNLEGRYAMIHEQWSDYKEFTSLIKLDADFDNSLIHFSDIGRFAPQMPENDFSLRITGGVRGTVADLRGRDLFVIAGERTIFRGNFDMLGLPDFNNTFIDLRIAQLSSEYADLERIRLSWDNAPDSGTLPRELERAGSMFFSGSFTGFASDLVAFGELTTEVGKLKMDLNAKGEQGSDKVRYTGNLETLGFDIGHILEIPELSTVAAKAAIEAESEGTVTFARLDGKIKSLVFKGYNYKNMDVQGELRSRRFAGKVFSRDPNVDLNFSGLVDFEPARPVFNFTAEVNNLNLTALNLVDLPDPFYFSSSIAMTGQGSGLADFSGSLSAHNSFLCYGDTVRLLNEAVLSAAGDDSGRKITLTSDIADVSITGVYNTSELYKGFHQMASMVMPSLRTDDDYEFSHRQDYEFSVQYKASDLVSSLLVDGLGIAPNTTLYGSFDNRSGRMDVLLRSDSIRYGSYALYNLVLNASKQDETFVSSVFLSELDVGGYILENPDISLKAFNDLVDFKLDWLNSDRSGSGEVALRANVIDFRTVQVDVDTLRIAARESTWRMTRPVRLNIDTTGVFVDGLIMANNAQRISAFGKLGSSERDEVLVTLKDIDLGYLDSLGLNLDYSFRGIANADLNVTGVLKNPVISASAGISNFTVNDTEIGDLTLLSNYGRATDVLDLEGSLTKQGFAVANFKGEYAVKEEEPLSGVLSLDNLDLGLVNLLELEEVDQFSGRANGEITVSGDLSSPRTNGYIDFEKAGFRVDYLNVFFEFSDRVRVEEDWLGIDYKPLADQEGNTGFVVASAFHDNFSDWSYDVSADVKDFLVLDTDRTMNEIFYGSARASGFLQIGGYDDFLEISIEAKTGRGTVLKLPLDRSSDVTLENFVYFINRDAKSTEEREANLDGVSLRINVEATPDAEIQLIFDERAGDIMRAKGSGILTLEISPSGEFEMFGRYEITEGSYLFTLQNLINKQFRVRSGSTVSWYGSPYEADLDIDAVYNLRTQLFPVMIENRDRYRTREDVNVVLKLTDKLLNPAISFSIELPQSTEIERSQLASALSTTQQLNQQVFALLILNRFLPVLPEQEGQGSAGGGFAGLGSATTSDFVSTQISNWLSEISNDFEIGLNYRPGDQISNQEIAVALSTQIFNERVLVSGNFGVTSPTEMQYTRGQSGLVGDFLLEYLITEDGRLRMKVFNETNPYEVFDQVGSIYTQGVGLIYQEDFNTLDEFFKKMTTLFSNDKVEKVLP